MLLASRSARQWSIICTPAVYFLDLVLSASSKFSVRQQYIFWNYFSAKTSYSSHTNTKIFSQFTNTIQIHRIHKFKYTRVIKYCYITLLTKIEKLCSGITHIVSLIDRKQKNRQVGTYITTLYHTQTTSR